MHARARRFWLPVVATLCVATSASAQVLPGLPPADPAQAPAAADAQVPPDDLTALRAGLERTIELVRRVTQRAGAVRSLDRLAETLPDFAAMARAHERWINQLLIDVSDRDADTLIELLAELKHGFEAKAEAGRAR